MNNLYITLKFLHSYWAYLVLLVVILATFNALIKFLAKKEYHAKDFRISLFALIVTHIQLLLGLFLFFVAFDSEYFSFKSLDHPVTMIIATVLITMGYSKHKTKRTSKGKFKTLSVLYTLALIAILSMIPWSVWFNSL